MIDIAARYDGWHAAQTLLPLAVGALGALIVWHLPRHLGKVVIVYAATCIGLVLAPLWTGDQVVTFESLRPVLIESKIAFIIGLAIVLAAGGADDGRLLRRTGGDGRPDGPE